MHNLEQANREENGILASITGRIYLDRYPLMKICVFQIPSGLNYPLWSEPKNITLCLIKQGWGRERFCLCTYQYILFTRHPWQLMLPPHSNQFLLNLDFHYMPMFVEKVLSKLPQLVDHKKELFKNIWFISLMFLFPDWMKF